MDYSIDSIAPISETQKDRSSTTSDENWMHNSKYWKGIDQGISTLSSIDHKKHADSQRNDAAIYASQ